MLRFILLALLFSLPLSASAQASPLADRPIAARAMAELQQLNLSAVQKQQLVAIALDARNRQQAISVDQQALLDTAQPALESGQADLIALTVQQQAITDRRIDAARATRDQLLAFYTDLDPTQRQQVQAWMANAITRIDALRALSETFQPWPALH
ncbi:Spy/CpxP family protein refolding chaperone [Pseudomarimonas arenosa]|uniref:LTXXQ motif family protein n=1 Tax=Pseudomarimonas arenosa TaxID=2774145 RepID=A0AAW3ZUS4_9GAMM|nr:Spy/CpxP family protein refolding chaperone [Pseudomarimonas arenosa]MBD8527841.1 hypothetical protein [Pseudomarimonas arenosa]